LSNSPSSGFMIVVWIFALVLWVLFGLWGGKMATRSGLEYWIGFLVGFFGGIVGILVLWLITRDRARENQRRMQYGQPPYPPAGYVPPAPTPRRTRSRCVRSAASCSPEARASASIAAPR